MNKIIKTDLNEEHTKTFEALKTYLGLGADSEVVRYAINYTYNQVREKS